MIFGGVGLGTFPFAGPFKNVSTEQATAALDAYFAAGGRYIDTAPTYAFGGIEKFLGNYLANRERDSFVLSTSCGYVREGNGYKVSGRRDDVLRDAQESLERLRLDYFDIYISHIPDPETPLVETATALQSLKDSGMTREIGVSNVDEHQLRQYLKGGEISIVQNRLSYINRELSPGIQALSLERNVRVIAYQVLERGLLTDAGPTITDGDLRAKKPEFETQRRVWVREHVAGPLRELATSEGLSVEALVVGWVLSVPGVGLAQIGATSPAQAQSIPGYAVPLSESVMRGLEEIYTNAEDDARARGHQSVRELLGLTTYDVRSGSASGT